MGYYIDKLENGTDLQAIGKALTLVDAKCAEFTSMPKAFSEVPADKALLCAVSNGWFDAVGLCYSEDEFKVFSDPSDDRLKKWLLMDKELAHRLSKYKLSKTSSAPPVEKTVVKREGEGEGVITVSGYTRERKFKKKAKKNSFRANYCKGYAVINGEVKEAKSKTPAVK